MSLGQRALHQVSWVGMLLRRPAAFRLFLIAALVFLVGHQVLYLNVTVDDLFISLTYARNLGDGLGLVHNQGLRVEGYSNFLWVVLLAACQCIGLDLVLAAKALGILFSLLTLLSTASLVNAMAPYRPRLAVVCTLAILAASPSFVMWGVSGLETPLYAFILVTAVRLLLLDLDRPSALPRSPLAFVLLAMTRPEGFAFGVLALLWQLCEARLSRHVGRAFILRWSVCYLAPLAGFLLWRYLYYGYWLPNTVYAKAGAGLVRQALRGLQYLYHFGSTSGHAILLFLFLLAGRPPNLRKRNGVVGALCVGYLVFVLASGADWMPQFRFLAPLLPLLGAMAVTEMAYLAAIARAKAPVLGVLLPASMLICCVGLGLVTTVDALFVTRSAWGLGQRGSRVDWIEYVAAHSLPTDTVAVVDAGRIGYDTHLQVLDMIGLLDTHIAHQAAQYPKGLQPARYFGYGKWDVQYVLERRPEFVQVHLLSATPGVEGHRTDWVGSDLLVNDPRFSGDYVPLGVNGGGLFARRDVAEGRGLLP